MRMLLAVTPDNKHAYADGTEHGDCIIAVAYRHL